MQRENNFPGLNLLRIVSCLIIVSYHYFPIAGGNNFFQACPLVDLIVSNGVIMVNLFFVISGFCMAANYKKRISEGMPFKEYFLNHYIKFLAFSLITTPVGVVSCLLGTKADMPSIGVSFSEVIREILCIKYGWVYTVAMPYNGPIWFINILLIMYIFYYICCKFKKVYLPMATFFMLLGLYTHYYVNAINWPLINDSSHIGFYNFFFGVLLYEIYLISRDERWRMYLFGGTFGLGTLILILIKYFSGEANYYGNIEVALLFTVWPFLIWLMLFLQPAIRLANTNFIRELSKVTTSIYIWHNPLMYILLYVSIICNLQIPFSNIGVFAIVVLFVLCIALFSNRFLEKRVIKLLSYMFDRYKPQIIA